MTVATGKYRILGIFVFYLRFSVFLGFLNTDFGIGFGFSKYRGFGYRPTSNENPPQARRESVFYRRSSCVESSPYWPYDVAFYFSVQTCDEHFFPTDTSRGVVLLCCGQLTLLLIYFKFTTHWHCNASSFYLKASHEINRGNIHVQVCRPVWDYLRLYDPCSAFTWNFTTFSLAL